jgi:hypothetical protein
MNSGSHPAFKTHFPLQVSFPDFGNCAVYQEDRAIRYRLNLREVLFLRDLPNLFCCKLLTLSATDVMLPAKVVKAGQVGVH